MESDDYLIASNLNLFLLDQSVHFSFAKNQSCHGTILPIEHKMDNDALNLIRVWASIASYALDRNFIIVLKLAERLSAAILIFLISCN